MNKCPFCNINSADKKNSHIIPKFLGKPLFQKTKPRHTIQIDKKGKSRKIQDIPKQDFLVCSTCEKRLEIIETYFAKKLITIRDYNNRKEKFKISHIGPNTILNCLDLNPIVFKLFSYSMIWRLSVTTNPLFKNFKLPKNVESEIGTFLNKNLFLTHSELINNFNSIQTYPDYHLMAYKLKSGQKDFIGIFTAFQMSKEHYGIFTCDMILFFYLKYDNIDTASQLISNRNNENVKFVLTDSTQWKEIGSAVVHKRLFNNNS